MKVRRRRILHETVELNITAFLNLMVVLVPFLLITAVFSRMTVLELTLPGPESGHSEQEPVELELQMLVYPDSLEIRDAQYGRIARFVIAEGKIRWKPVTETLLNIKSRFPDSRSISLLLHPEVNYRQLIDIMDHVSVAQVVNQATLDEFELFPDVAVGDVPSSAIHEEVSIEDLVKRVNASGGDKDAN